MVKLSDLIQLEKKVDIDIGKAHWQDTDVELGRIRTVVELDGRYYLRELTDGEITAFFEVAVDWRINAQKTQFAFTPDDRHIYYFCTGQKIRYSVRCLDYDQVKPGDTCTYNGMTAEFVHDGKIRLNGKDIPVQTDPNYTYSLLKKKIKAIGGARGLFIFLDRIAEEATTGTLPLFEAVWKKIADHYGV